MAVRPIDALELRKRMCAICNQDYADEPCEPSDCFFIRALNETPTLTQPPVTGDTSDGYHTFNELYHHRAVLFSVICNGHPDIAWKSKKHHDGTMYDGMFIVGINTPEGPATYHYDVDPYWGMFRVKELETAPEWDGHTPDEAIRRISTLTQLNDPLTLDELRKIDTVTPLWVHNLSWGRYKPRLMLVRYVASNYWSCVDFDGFEIVKADDYGSRYLIYRRPSEGEEETP